MRIHEMMEEPKKWAITVMNENNFIDGYNNGDLVQTYEGSFMDVMRFVDKHFEDGDVDVEEYEEWLDRQ